MTQLLITSHVILMFVGVAMSQGPALLLWNALRRGDVVAIRGILNTGRISAKFIGPVYLVGVLLGLVAVFTGKYNPLAGWLIIAYVLTLVAFISPQVLITPTYKRLGMAAGASPIEAPSAELRAEIVRATTPVFWLDALVILLLIIDMVLKPFS